MDVSAAAGIAIDSVASCLDRMPTRSAYPCPSKKKAAYAGASIATPTSNKTSIALAKNKGLEILIRLLPLMSVGFSGGSAEDSNTNRPIIQKKIKPPVRITSSGYPPSADTPHNAPACAAGQNRRATSATSVRQTMSGSHENE